MRPLIRYLLPLFLFLAAATHGLHAQDVPINVKGFPQPFGPVNAGREFWLAFPANWDQPGATSYYIRLYITSGVRTQVKVWAGRAIKKVFYTIPNDIVTVDLTPIEAQMFTRIPTDPVPPDQIYKQRGIHIEAEAPVVVYGMNRTSFTSDGLLALSVNSLGREYIISAYPAVVGRDGATLDEAPAQYMIIAPHDGTIVTINHPHRTPNHVAGETFTVQLSKGDVWSAMNLGYNSDMSGATIRSNKPVAVIAGVNCAYIPNLLTFPACDHIVEMMLPTESWGKIYHGVPFQTRLKGDFYRIFAKQPNTTIYINGVEYAKLGQVGGQEGDGWVEYRALGKGLQEFTADKPINVSQYNTSQTWDGVPSDPFYLALTPVEQYQNGVLFCTPSADFPQNFVNVVIETDAYNTLEITPAGTENWQLFSSASGVGVPRTFPTKVNGKPYLGIISEIRPGTYRMRCQGKFAAYLYGFSNFDSYGYPLSVATGDLTKADKDAPIVIKTQTCDGTVSATTKDLPEDDNLRTNLSSIELDPDPANTENYGLIVTPFEAGVSRQTTYTLTVVDKSRPAKAVMIISDMAGNVTLDSVYYNPLAITMLPSPQDYGKLRSGSTLTRSVTITNLSEESVELKEVLLKSGAQGFRILEPTGNVLLGPKGSPTESVEVKIEYTATIIRPDALQVYEDSVGVRDACGLRYMALVKAQVVKPMIRVTDHDFGTQPVLVETTPSWQMEVRNTSTIEGSTLTVTAHVGPLHNTTVQIFDVKSGTALPVPFTLEPNETKDLQITATAPTVGEFRDTIFFTSDAMDVAEGDDYGWLLLQGIKGDLYATPYDWHRRRENYDYPQTAAVSVNNRGDAPVSVVKAEIVGPDAASFTFDPGQVNGLTIPANGGMIPVNVTFSPRRTGPHTAKIVYTVNPAQDEEVSSQLDGYGTMPALETKDYDFGTMTVNQDVTDFIDYNTEVAPTPNDRIMFTVPNREEIDFVTITGFQWTTDGFGGNDDFTHTLSLPTPIVLNAGDRYTVDGQFKARAGGLRQATITAVTLDGVDATSKWTGTGLVDNAAIALQATTPRPLCVGETGLITVTLSNVGESDLTITNLEMDGGPFTIVDPTDPTAAFVIPEGGSHEVLIVYTAQKGTQTANLRVTSDASNTQNGVSLQEVSGTGLDENWNTVLKLIGSEQNGTTAKLGNQITAELSLDATFQGMPTGMSMSSYTVVLEYNPALMTPRLPATVGGGSSTGATVAVDPALTNLKAGKLVLKVTGFMSSNSTPLLQVPFAVLFSNNLVRDMKATVTSDANCLVINPSQSTINVAPICGLNLRMITLTSANYTLDQNKPNPFNPVTKIRYSVGLDGLTTVQLFDAQGRMVQVLVNEHQQPGVYELTLDVTNLPSGNYYYTMVSGDYKETRMLTVTK